VENSIKHLRELAAQGIVHGNPQATEDPDEVPCTRPLLQKVVQSAPLTYAPSLAIFALGQDDERQTVGEVTDKLWQLEDGVSSPLQACVSAVKKLNENNENILQKLLDKLSKIEDRFNSLRIQARVASVRRKTPFCGISSRETEHATR